MAFSTRPPEKQPKVTAFDPLVLDRTVIAVPLLEEMKEDLNLIEAVKKAHPNVTEYYNSGLEFNERYPEGVEKARTWAEQTAATVAQAVLKASKERLKSALGEQLKVETKRDRILEKEIAAQHIGEIQPDTNYSFAVLHASVIRRLLVANDRSVTAGQPEKPIARIHPKRFEVIIDLNLEYPGGREVARAWVLEHIEEAKKLEKVRDAGQQVHFEKDQINSQYVFARLEARAIQRLVLLDMAAAKELAEERSAILKTDSDSSKCRAIYHVWPDFEISACINKSVATVKADAAQNSFSALGADITWAVMDSGILADHPHFSTHKNLDVSSILHKDFTVDGSGPFDDQNGHGTHVAGIIAGEWPPADAPPKRPAIAVSRNLKTDKDDVEYREIPLARICGMAPRCRLVSLRVLDENGKGVASNLIAAIGHVQEMNGYGRRLLIHGVNMSVGYTFEPEWFACGQSPLCVEVDRLVKSGVVVVVAAGNTGYGTLRASAGVTSAGMALTINDPGNADLAITVGSTHRDMPHIYGVSYFSSKGPTGDGRLKPDLVAPGEKIISCATGTLKTDGAKNKECDYVETSGTSMAAPHVSGVIAAFLSVRGEFVGKAERVKEIFLSTATDLKRDRYFQGAGLVDLMRAIQSV